MTDSQFEEYLAEAVQAVQVKNGLLEQQYGLGRYARWDHDGDLDQLSFSNPDNAESLVAITTCIGSYSLETKTWLWAWANESNSYDAREQSAKLKGLFDTTGNLIFIEPHIECDEYLAWELAAVSVQHLEGVGCYRGPSGHLWIFWSINKIAPVISAT